MESLWETAQMAIQSELAKAAARLFHSEIAVAIIPPTEEGRGDWTSNIAFRLAKTVKRPPPEIARQLLEHLAELPMVERMEVAGAGFINFWLNSAWLAGALSEAAQHPDTYGAARPAGQRVLIEFVSANPTGPLLVVNGRAAAVGDSLARILSAAG